MIENLKIPYRRLVVNTNNIIISSICWLPFMPIRRSDSQHLESALTLRRSQTVTMQTTSNSLQEGFLQLAAALKHANSCTQPGSWFGRPTFLLETRSFLRLGRFFVQYDSPFQRNVTKRRPELHHSEHLCTGFIRLPSGQP